VRYLVELDSAEAGGKARSLARLHAAGLPTPRGFAIGDALFRALRAGAPPLPARLDAIDALDEARAALERTPWPPSFLAELDAALQGERFSVRSSFASEDDPDALAAGVYQSRVNVARAEVAAAVREVLLSAIAPAAMAYAAAHGRALAAPPVAVLVHEYIPGQPGSAALDAPDGSPVITPHPSPEVEAALRALAAQHGPVEIEWTAPPVTFLQLRPYRPPPPPQPWAGFAGIADPAAWRWDAAHNPLPLSPAQAGLVALANERCRIGIRQQVLGGYLFWAPGGPAPLTAIDPSRARAELAALRDEVEPRLGDRDLEGALDLFVAAYDRLFGVIQPAARAGRDALARYLRTLPHPPALAALLGGVPSMAAERRRLASALGRDDPSRAEAAYLALFGDEAPIWDVAVPTYRERPEALRAITGASEPPPAPQLPPEAQPLLAVARDCATAGEDDDWLYARLQAVVRRALLAVGERLHAAGALAAPDDVFFLPLPVARAAAGGTTAQLTALARAGRAAYEAALLDPPPAATTPSTHVLRGAGTGGRVVGRVHRHHPGVPGPPDAVLVAQTLLPTELPLITAAALIIETGGPLDHVATQARERGLPALVGVAGARHLQEGERVLVDADQGLLVRMPDS
jgi:phosphohistidine swiveling domain-containing protein